MLKGGRSLERTRVAALGRAGRRTRCSGSATRWWRSTSGPSSWRSCARREPDVAFIALHGRDGEDGTVQGLLEAIGVPYTGSGPAACMRCTDKVLAKYLMREAGIPTPDFHSFKESAIKELGAAAALPGLERELGFPLVVKPASQGSALGVKFARSRERAAGRARGGLLLRPQGPARALRQGPRPGRVGARRAEPRDDGPRDPWRCRSSRRSRARRTSTTTSRATRSG